MTKPAIMHLISEIPEPAAYGAKDLTRVAATKAKKVCQMLVSLYAGGWLESYTKDKVEKVVHGFEAGPSVPLRATFHIVSLDLILIRARQLTILLSPAAKVLVQVEPRFAVPDFSISQPLGDDV